VNDISFYNILKEVVNRPEWDPLNYYSRINQFDEKISKLVLEALEIDSNKMVSYNEVQDKLIAWINKDIGHIDNLDLPLINKIGVIFRWTLRGVDFWNALAHCQIGKLDDASRLALANILAREDSCSLAENFDKFNIQDERDRFSIAKSIAEREKKT